MSQNLKPAAILAVFVAVIGCLAWVQLRPPAVDKRVYRIGWMISPPFQVRASDGSPSGLSVDLVSEAARRRGISLQWVFWPDSSESALKSKQVDLWPLITITPARLKLFHITEPYLEHDHCLLVRSDSPYRKIEDLATAAIGISNVSIDTVHLRILLPGARPVARPVLRDALRDTCSGQTSAVFADRYTAMSALLEIPDCGGTPLRWIGVPQIRSRLGIGSTFEASAAADALRGEIGAMATEGRLAAIFGQWGFLSGLDVESVEALLNAKHRETLLIAATVLFACLFGLACAQTVRLVRERDRTRRAEAALHESQARSMQAQKMESIGRLAGGIAHDFNNLLTVINGYSDIVYNKLGETDALRSYVDEICKAGEQAAELTQQLLVFGRKQVVQPRAVKINSVIRESEKMFRRLVGEDIEIITRLSAEAGQVLADPGQIHQVLMNLVVNARDAMPDGGRLVIETALEQTDPPAARNRREASGGPTVRLTVTDTGHGMDEQTREHIFEPFFTTKGMGHGTGLGLATVYGIVEQSRGWISVDSAPGKGSSFQVHLPWIAGADPADSTPTTDTARAGASETVLVVEDQVEVRAFAVSALSAYGYRVLDASSGEDALDLCGRHPGPIDVLVTDVVMPGINGRELADRLKMERPKLSVLYTSGYTQDVIANRGVMDRNVAFLAKPYTANELAAKIREVVKRGD